MSNISDLLLQQGQIAANARLASTQAKTQAISGVVNTIGQTIADIPKLKAQELQAKSNQLSYDTSKLNYDELQKKLKDDDVAKGIMSQFMDPSTGKTDYQGASRALLAKGLYEHARQVQADGLSAAKETSLAIQAHVAVVGNRLAQARTLWNGVHDQASLDRVRPQLEATMGPELKAHIPKVFDQQVVDDLSKWGASQKDLNDMQTFSMNEAQKAIDARTKEKADIEKDQNAWAAWLASSVSNQKQYDDAMNQFAANGFDTSVLTSYGTQWNPDVKKKATAFAVGAKEEATNAARTTGDSVTQSGENARQQAASRQAAITWRENEMAKLRDKMHPKVMLDFEGRQVTQPALSPEDYAKEIGYIDNSYNLMLKSIGGSGGGGASSGPVTVQVPGRGAVTFPDQDSANKFKKAAGIK